MKKGSPKSGTPTIEEFSRCPEKCSYQDIVWYNIMRNVTRCLDYLVVGEALRRATVRGGACLARPTGRVPP